MYEYNFVVHFKAQVAVLGIKVSSDILITPSMMMFQIESNIWGLFFARINFEASLGKGWYALEYGVKGDFLVKEEENNFSGSYLDGLRSLSKEIANAANKSLEMAKGVLKSVTNGLVSARSYLSIAQDKLRSANSAFDWAIISLNVAKPTWKKQNIL